MNGSRAFVAASVPAAAGLVWQQYRRAVRDIEGCSAVEPVLPGRRRRVTAPWGSATYRLVAGDPRRAPLVLVHGWGKTADSAWWPVVAATDRTVVAVDLPGHGLSQLGEVFSFEVAADAVVRCMADADVDRPVLVGHSMGGPVGFATIRRLGARRFSRFVALATSAYWVRPRISVILRLAPIAMAPRSPILIHRQRSDVRRAPDVAEHITWAYTRRPARRMLEETAVALRRFDARSWTDLELPPTTWVVAANDGVLASEHQHASARHFDASVVEVDANHAIVLSATDAVLEVLDRV